VLLNSAKVASNGEAKALSAKTASPSEAKSQGEATLASLVTKKKPSSLSQGLLNPRGLTSDPLESQCWISLVLLTQT